MPLILVAGTLREEVVPLQAVQTVETPVGIPKEPRSNCFARIEP